jgi:myo-inositol 2-dehydrogenase/D-chiro-inositol 1-dehydrogenase
MAKRSGVGPTGAGPVTQAIHMPAIVSLAERLRVLHMMDVDRNVAETVALRAAAGPAPTPRAYWKTGTSSPRISSSGQAGVVAISGTDEDWVERVRRAVKGDARGVFLACPGRADPVTLRQLGADTRVAGSPFWWLPPIGRARRGPTAWQPSARISVWARWRISPAVWPLCRHCSWTA